MKDMSHYQPYRKMARTCRTRPMRERRIVWTRHQSPPLHDGKYQLNTLSRDLVEAAAELWRCAYPEVYGSPHEFLLDAEQYENVVALHETWEHDAATKVYCMPVVVELQTSRVVAASLMTKIEKNLQVEFSFVGTHPDYRLRDLTDELRRTNRAIARNSGAEYITTFCETWHEITQNWCIEAGWRIAGIFPGNFTRWNGENQEYRACEVHFYRFADDAENYVTRPEEWHLATEVKAVWEALERVNQKIEQRFQERKTRQRDHA